jgi:hypothetical protein
LGIPCARVGNVEDGEGSYINGCRVEGLERIDLNKLYGSFNKADKK